jgi:hypothetical protein
MNRDPEGQQQELLESMLGRNTLKKHKQKK